MLGRTRLRALPAGTRARHLAAGPLENDLLSHEKMIVGEAFDLLFQQGNRIRRVVRLADSGVKRNTFRESGNLFRHGFSWRFPAQCFSWTRVQQVRNAVELHLTDFG